MIIKIGQAHSHTMRIALILFVSVIGFVSELHAQEFVEGKHYTIIETQLPYEPNRVAEYFSFSCPGCYAIEPHLNRLVKTSPSVSLRRVHMPFGGRNAMQSQKVFVLLKLLNAEHHSDAVFKRIHEQKKIFHSDGDILEFFNELGFEMAVVDSELKSFSADTMLRKMNKEAKELKISSVPSIVINNRYMVNLQSIYTGDELSALLIHLNSMGESK